MHDDVLNSFNKSPENNFEILVSLFSKHDVDEDDILRLANILANSGEIINDINGLDTADIPSTGGPSSLTTLLCPLYLVNIGYTVLKLGIPGRPAGGIDVLSQIQNYKIKYNNSELKSIILNSYIHFLANDAFTPLDAELYTYRKKTGNVNLPNLAIASILSKKIALGIKNIGLDVRVWSDGNFGTSFEDARLFSKKFIRVANMAGIKAKCFLSDASQPYQPYIGRGESLIAIYEILNNCANHWLQDHNKYCRDISNQLKINFTRNKSRDIKVIFTTNLELQGSSYDMFINKVNRVIEDQHYDIISLGAGYCYYNLNYMRDHIVNEQNKLIDKHTLFSDPCGFVLMKRPGTFVNAGEVIASYRTKKKETLKQAEKIYFIEKQCLTNIKENEVIE
jgi:pyrimidine-nucleoside phosphorylase